MKVKLFLLTSIILVGVLGFFSCKKSSNNPNNYAQMNIRLTDDPANYDAVYIDIAQIGITVSGNSEVMLTPYRPGIYNLLSFRNGLDTLLINASLPAGNVGQIRLILGNGNSVTTGGVNYPLTTPSAQESGLKLNLNQTLAANGSYEIWIDFDAGKSIVQTGSGKFILKPVIRAFSALTNGKIEGYALPAAALTTVYAINGTDTIATAIPSNTNGYFVMSGLAEGAYQLVFSPANTTYFSYSTTVSVSYGIITNVGTITLHL